MHGGHTPIGTDVERAADILRQGGLVAIPTETVYGLAADALNPRAVAGIFAAKNRPAFDPLIVHLGGIDWLPQVAKQVPPLAERLMARFWPGPLTIILEKTAAIADLVTSGLPSVAVRMPRHPLALHLLQVVQRPLAAPSANLFGQTSPTTASHVSRQLDGRIDYILDGGPCGVGVESTIIRVEGQMIQILRPGGVTREELSEFGSVVLPSAEDSDSMPLVPGQLKEHYAPRTPLRIIEPPVDFSMEQQMGLLTLNRRDWSAVDLARFDCVRELSPRGELEEAAAGFFAALHEMDEAGLDLILATPFPDHGLGLALNDRLRRAAHE